MKPDDAEDQFTVTEAQLRRVFNEGAATAHEATVIFIDDFIRIGPLIGDPLAVAMMIQSWVKRCTDAVKEKE